MHSRNYFIFLLFLSAFFICCKNNDNCFFGDTLADSVYQSDSGIKFCKADAFKYKHDFDQALLVFDSLSKTNLSRDELIYALNQSIYLALSINEKDRAKIYSSKLDSLNVNWSKTSNADRGDDNLNRGIYLLYNDSLYVRADSFFEIAVGYYRHYYPAEHIKMAQCLVWIGLLKLKTQPDAAQSYFEEAQEMYARHPIWQLGRLECKLGLATFKIHQRSFKEAIDYCDDVIMITRAAPKQHIRLLIQALALRESCLIKMGKIEEALKLSHEAFDMAEKYNYNDIGSILSSILQVYVNNDTSEVVIFEKINQIKVLEDRGLIKSGYASFWEGMYHSKHLQWNQTIHFLEIFLTSEVCMSNLIMKDQALYSLAYCYQKIGNFNRAITLIKEDIKLGKGGKEVYCETNGFLYPIATEATEYEFNSFSLLGRFFLKKYYQTNQIQDLKQASIIFSSLDSLYLSRLANIDEETLLNMQAEFVDSCYPYALEATYAYFKRTNNPSWKDQAFRYSERIKSGIMFKEMLSRQAGHEKNYNYLQDSLAKVKNQINRLSLKIESGNTLLPAEQTKYRELSEIKSGLQYRLKEKSKQYLQNAYIETHDLGKIQSGLAPDEAVVQYAFGRDHLHIIYIDRTHVDFIQKDNSVEIWKSVKKYQKYLSPDSLNCNQYVELSNAVYKDILGPISNRLKKIRKILIIPDGPFQFIPFDALVDPAKLKPNIANYTFAKLPYLVKDFQISYAPSWKVHAINQEKSGSVVPNGAIGIWIDTTFQFWNKHCLKRYQTALSYTTPSFFLGSRCTRAGFISHYGDLDIISFNLHGLSNPKSSLDYKLYFAGSSSETLFGYEVKNMRFNRTKLIVLGVCDSSKGKQTSAEGPATLTRSFMQAGIPWVVAGLYNIDESATNEILIEFYAQLRIQAGDVTKALQQAKTNFIARERNGYETGPYFWSGLIVQH